MLAGTACRLIKPTASDAELSGPSTPSTSSTSAAATKPTAYATTASSASSRQSVVDSNPEMDDSPTSRGSTSTMKIAWRSRSMVTPSAHISMVMSNGSAKSSAPPKARASAMA